MRACGNGSGSHPIRLNHSLGFWYRQNMPLRLDARRFVFVDTAVSSFVGYFFTKE
jgi:hypothetical protein